MRNRQGAGVWEIFIPGIGENTHYKFEIKDAAQRLLPLKADPLARQMELRPG